MLNYYKILEIPDFSDEKIIKGAYRNLSKKYHPDVNKDPAASDYFIAINNAYEILNNALKKEIYDRELYNFLHAVTTTANQEVQLNYFKVHSEYFNPNDYITVSWDVMNASNVFIDGLGWVSHQGSSSILVQEYGEVFTLSMKAYNNQGTVYEWKHTLKNIDYNPTIEAFNRFLKEGKQVDVKHFKKENQFNTFGRISSKTFIYRIIKSVFLGFFIIYIHRGRWFENDLLDILIILAVLLYGYCQLVKRKNDLHNNYASIADLFQKNSNELFTIYGPKEEKNKTLRERFRKQNIYSKSAIISLGIVILSYFSLFILPKKEQLEQPIYHDTYIVDQGRDLKRAVAVLYFEDFNITYEPDSKIFENFSKKSNFYVGRLAVFNKPIYVKTKHFVNHKEEEYKYYVGINDANNVLVICLILMMLFHLWLFYTLDKKYSKFRNISLICLSLFYIFYTFCIFQ